MNALLLKLMGVFLSPTTQAICESLEHDSQYWVYEEPIVYHESHRFGIIADGSMAVLGEGSAHDFSPTKIERWVLRRFVSAFISPRKCGQSLLTHTGSSGCH